MYAQLKLDIPSSKEGELVFLNEVDTMIRPKGGYTFVDGTSTGSLECFSAEELKSKGILPVVEKCEDFDTRTEKQTPRTLIVSNSEVTMFIGCSPKTEKEQREYDRARLNKFRVRRDQLLTNSDWTQFADSPLSDAEKTEWATYRQALRDLPNDLGDVHPDDIIFPEKP